MNAAGWTISIIAIITALVLAVRWERDSRRTERRPPVDAPERTEERVPIDHR